MEYQEFNQVQHHLQQLFRKNKFAAALNLATESFKRFPDQRALLYYWRITLNALLHRPDQANALLAEALEDNLWFSEYLLRKSPSLQTLQGDREFEELVAQNLKQQQADRTNAFPIITLRSQGSCGPGKAPCPLLIALHANGSNARESMPFWQAAASAGWLVAVIQSSLAMWKDAYMWDDRQLAESEVRKNHASLLEQYAIDEQRTVIAGHSMGGEVAIGLALRGVVPVRGFIAIGPGGPLLDTPKEWPTIIQNAPAGLRGYFIIGTEDNSIPQGNVRKLLDQLQAGGVTCQLEEIPQAEHDFNPIYAQAVLRGLKFIEK